MCIPQGTLLGLTLHIAHVQHWTCSADRIPFLKGLIWSKTIKSKPIQALCKLAMSANKGTSRTPNDYAHTHTRTELHQETCGRMHCEMCNKWLALREQRLLQTVALCGNTWFWKVQRSTILGTWRGHLARLRLNWFLWLICFIPTKLTNY